MHSYIDTYRLALELLELTERKLTTVQRTVSLKELWASMSFCILSSNVRLDAANKAHRAIHEKPSLFTRGHDTEALETRIQNRLVHTGYRFHKTKAVQLAKSWVALRDNHTKLVELFSTANDVFIIREYVISTFSGIGIKQASMFLRDIGATCELAIIDTHIRRFLAAHVRDFNPSIKREYLLAESWLGELAHFHACSVAAVDLAIWAAAKTLGRSKTC